MCRVNSLLGIKGVYEGIRISGFESREERPHVADYGPSHITRRKKVLLPTKFVFIEQPVYILEDEP